MSKNSMLFTAGPGLDVLPPAFIPLFPPAIAAPLLLIVVSLKSVALPVVII